MFLVLDERWLLCRQLLQHSGDAAIAGATVTTTNREDGARRSLKSYDAGRFSFPQLKPGPYTVKVEADAFEPQQNNAVFAGLGQKQAVDFSLKLAAARQDVTGEVPLINPENPNAATTLNKFTMAAMPDAGNDLTYPIQFAPGALMNTAAAATIL
jgi:hypothetical protein